MPQDPDLTRSAEPAAEQCTVLIVQLLPAKSSQQKFLRQLQDALGGSATLSSLTSGPSEDVFVIPGATEKLLRDKAKSAEAGIEQLLRKFGALTVNNLHADALFALMYRGSVVLPDGPVGTKKISNVSAPTRFRSPAKAANLLPQHFRGPYDWNLGPRGANVIAAWEMFAVSPVHQSQLPWKDIRVAHIDTGYTEHAALGWQNGHSDTVDVGRGTDYWPPQDSDPRDEWLAGFPGHGTRISGAIAGYMPGASSNPFYGVAPGVQIVPYRVTDSVIVDHVPSGIAAAIREPIADECHIVNISLGALRGDRHVGAALDAA